MFWDNLQSLLIQNHITQAELARICNIKTATISKWKTGHQPTPKMLLTLSSYFNVSIDFLLGNTERQFKTENYILNNEEKQIIENFQKADQHKQIVIKELLHIQ